MQIPVKADDLPGLLLGEVPLGHPWNLLAQSKASREWLWFLFDTFQALPKPMVLEDDFLNPYFLPGLCRSHPAHQDLSIELGFAMCDVLRLKMLCTSVFGLMS